MNTSNHPTAAAPLARLAAASALALLAGGCVVAPLPPPMHRAPPVVVEPAYVPPPGVVYVAPTYAMPGPGYAWRYHPRYGWGWFHAQSGWHRGWR